MPDCVKDFFRKFFPDINLDRVEVYNSLPPGVQRLTPINVDAITLGRHIFFDDSYSPGTVRGFAAIAHELVHVRQWYESAGFLRSNVLHFPYRYFGEYFKNSRRGMSGDEAYEANPYEQEADRFKDSVLDMISESPCACGE